MSPRTPRDDAFGADDLRPLTELPAADRAALCGLAFDIDDTVTAHGKLQPEAFDAMWRLHRAGVRLVAVTGRPLGWAAVVARQWPVDVAVGENGAGWFAGSVGRPAGSPAQGFFDGEEDRAEQRTLLASILAQVRATLPHVPLANDQGGRLCDLAFDVGEEAQLGAEDRAALVALIERAGARAVVSSVHAHAVPGDWNKAVGVVRAVAHILGEDITTRRERWAFVGDSGNDVEAFAYFPVSVGVANVREQLPLACAPRYVTRAARAAGFAELADVILAARPG
ncbi:MAG: HAD hydrolase family protein [Polyangiales bacterium]|nr:HAD hydrolase family protein [Myxococcales bacterium]MCB9658719.1 HAD hydrolase family protein [Sandaracinaceae bacterium]